MKLRSPSKRDCRRRNQTEPRQRNKKHRKEKRQRVVSFDFSLFRIYTLLTNNQHIHVITNDGKERKKQTNRQTDKQKERNLIAYLVSSPGVSTKARPRSDRHSSFARNLHQLIGEVPQSSFVTVLRIRKADDRPIFYLNAMKELFSSHIPCTWELK